MSHPITKVAAAVTALAAFGLGGSAIANATSASTTSTTTSTTHSAPSGRPPARFPAPGTAAHEGAEKAVTGDSAAKARAAAVKSVGGGTAGAVTTDFTGNGFEVAVTKTDGAKVEVHLDSSYHVVQGCLGGPGGMHGPGGQPPSSGA